MVAYESALTPRIELYLKSILEYGLEYFWKNKAELDLRFKGSHWSSCYKLKILHQVFSLTVTNGSHSFEMCSIPRGHACLFGPTSQATNSHLWVLLVRMNLDWSAKCLWDWNYMILFASRTVKSLEILARLPWLLASRWVEGWLLTP